MFTGLVEDTGILVGTREEGGGRVLTIRTSIPMSEVAVGDSIAVDGCCLTAERFTDDGFVATAGRETLKLTTLGAMQEGRRVHLERALRVGDRLGGHLVQGHVDGMGEIRSIEALQESIVVWVTVPQSLSRYVAAKGSICIDGVSLTVNEIDGNAFRVNLVPHTAEVTHMGEAKPGDTVNLEVDILAKYVERMLLTGEMPHSGGLTREALERAGY